MVFCGMDTNAKWRGDWMTDPTTQFVREAFIRFQKGDLAGAEASFRGILAQEPTQIDALNLLAMILTKQKKYGEAIKLLQEGNTLTPDNVVLLSNLGGLYNEVNDPLSAIRVLRKVLRLKPDHIDATTNLGVSFRLMGRISEARIELERALKGQPNHARSRLELAILERNIGNTHDAMIQLRKLRLTYPTDPHLIIQSLLTDKVTPDTPELQQAETIARSALGASSRTSLFYALAKAYDDLGNYSKAMACLVEAKAGSEFFDMEAHRGDYAILKDVFNPIFLQARKEWGNPSDLPVFIVGLPRSGTSLVEQIIASHPQAFGAGELYDLGFLAASFGMKGFQKETRVDPMRITNIAANEIAAVSTQYLEGLLARGTGAIRITDKMPHNYERLGLIALMFPHARVIHCRRSPLDTCLSIYMQDFGHSHGYASDLQMLGEYYQAYDDLMTHWQTVLPLRMLEVKYEKLLADTEGCSRRIVEFLGLQWDNACLGFPQTKRNVGTASHWQVRQSIYTSSVGRWRNYKNYLQPLIETLGSEVDAV
jgi:tetratricopeptide (TPR) repeat protein